MCLKLEESVKEKTASLLWHGSVGRMGVWVFRCLFSHPGKWVYLKDGSDTLREDSRA